MRKGGRARGSPESKPRLLFEILARLGPILRDSKHFGKGQQCSPEVLKRALRKSLDASRHSRQALSACGKEEAIDRPSPTFTHIVIRFDRYKQHYRDELAAPAGPLSGQ
ncbi:uncharacterized protein PGTG_17366 [Puccinia graminis f. sp. tritici CRL 75-36-700-3]|uniref:Uncharacterized protein n=1 Tax=Puccinia graminis f. sp. tritici (strain CRL 75-36-700-3 / race SCCL) TaxID=418459 RepID=E3L4D5_PUCGT|nr:uncharacterized protein PGTG_17366 [Puccinia graminis f. sp. tritici CRL 75-36-700-3]EFP91410.2 hypothetical protein PGTG_17366 [Puccinia graminis f. sp. tritici CRL 75-36-700-3]